jgi:hypothetical protein
MREVCARAHGVKTLKTHSKFVNATLFVRARRRAASGRPLPAMSCAPVRAGFLAGVRARSRARGGALAAPAPPALLSRFLDGKAEACRRDPVEQRFCATTQGALDTGGSG